MTIEGYTLGEISRAARTIGDDGLFLEALKGAEFACETIRRFLAGDAEHIAQGAESAECHRTLTV